MVKRQDVGSASVGLHLGHAMDQLHDGAKFSYTLCASVCSSIKWGQHLPYKVFVGIK